MADQLQRRARSRDRSRRQDRQRRERHARHHGRAQPVRIRREHVAGRLRQPGQAGARPRPGRRAGPAGRRGVLVVPGGRVADHVQRRACLRDRGCRQLRRLRRRDFDGCVIAGTLTTIECHGDAGPDRRHPVLVHRPGHEPAVGVARLRVPGVVNDGRAEAVQRGHGPEDPVAPDTLSGRGGPREFDRRRAGCCRRQSGRRAGRGGRCGRRDGCLRCKRHLAAVEDRLHAKGVPGRRTQADDGVPFVVAAGAELATVRRRDAHVFNDVVADCPAGDRRRVPVQVDLTRSGRRRRQAGRRHQAGQHSGGLLPGDMGRADPFRPHPHLVGGAALGRGERDRMGGRPRRHRRRPVSRPPGLSGSGFPPLHGVAVGRLDRGPCRLE